MLWGVICLVYIVYFSFSTVAAYMGNKVVYIKCSLAIVIQIVKDPEGTKQDSVRLFSGENVINRRRNVVADALRFPQLGVVRQIAMSLEIFLVSLIPRVAIFFIRGRGHGRRAVVGVGGWAAVDAGSDQHGHHGVDGLAVKLGGRRNVAAARQLGVDVLARVLICAIVAVVYLVPGRRHSVDVALVQVCANDVHFWSIAGKAQTDARIHRSIRQVAPRYC